MTYSKNRFVCIHCHEQKIRQNIKNNKPESKVFSVKKEI